MYVIPFVIIFLMIFGIFSVGDFQRYQNFKTEQEAYLSSSFLFRTCRKKPEEKTYLKLKKPYCKKPSEKEKDTQKSRFSPEESEIKEKGNNLFTHHRDGYFRSEHAKVDLYSLLGEELRYPLLYDVTLRYIERAYGKNLLSREGVKAKTILDAMIMQGKKIKAKYPDFSDLYPDDLKLYSVYYKMLKGTHYCNMETGKGYPALADIFKIINSDLLPIGMSYAPSVLLEILFGEKIKTEICALEDGKQVKRVVTKEEFEAIIKNATDHKVHEIENMINKDDFDTKLGYTNFAIDEKTKMMITN